MFSMTFGNHCFSILTSIREGKERADGWVSYDLAWIGTRQQGRYHPYFRIDDRKEWVSDLVKLKERLTSKIQKLQKRHEKLVKDATRTLRHRSPFSVGASAT